MALGALGALASEPVAPRIETGIHGRHDQAVARIEAFMSPKLWVSWWNSMVMGPATLSLTRVRLQPRIPVPRGFNQRKRSSASPHAGAGSSEEAKWMAMVVVFRLLAFDLGRPGRGEIEPDLAKWVFRQEPAQKVGNCSHEAVSLARIEHELGQLPDVVLVTSISR